MKPLESQLAQLLLNTNVLDQFQYQAVADRQGQTGRPFHLTVLDQGLASEDKVMAGLSKVSGIPLIQLEKMKVDPRAVACLPGNFCKQHQVFPAALRDGGKNLWLAMADPLDAAALQAARNHFTLGAIRPLVGLPSEIRSYIQAYYGAELSSELASPFSEHAIDLSLGSDEEEEAEFKITDMSGHTLVKHRDKLAGQAEAVPARRPTAAADLEPQTQGPSMTLDQRLTRLEGSQEKASRIIRVLVELLLEKGFFSPEDYRSKVK